MVYIKLSLEKDNNIDYVYCWSFHIDYDEYL